MKTRPAKYDDIFWDKYLDFILNNTIADVAAKFAITPKNANNLKYRSRQRVANKELDPISINDLNQGFVPIHPKNPKKKRKDELDFCPDYLKPYLNKVRNCYNIQRRNGVNTNKDEIEDNNGETQISKSNT